MKLVAFLGLSYRSSQLLAQGLLVLTSPLFLSESVLGYFFTMMSLASSQVLFELGLGQILVVFFARLISESRTNSICDDYQISLLYKTATILYAIIATLFFIVGGILGFLLLDTSGILSRQVWLPPWILLCLMISLNIINNKNLLYIESTGREKSVFSIRSIQYLLGALIYIVFSISGFGLWSVCAVPLGCFLISILWLNTEKVKLLFLFKEKHYNFRSVFKFWNNNLLPLQIKTSASFLSGFITLQLFLPLVFKFYGPDAAAYVGFSLNIMMGITLVSSSFSTANVRLFASYAKRHDIQSISRLFKQSLLFTLLMSFFSILICSIIIPRIPYLSDLVPNMWIFIVLGLGCISNSITYCYAIYLRSYLKEPLVNASLIAALTSLILFAIINSSNLSAFVTAYSFTSLLALIISTFITRSNYKLNSL